MSSQRILTGIKPTGYLHIGNYLGAIRPILELSRTSSEVFLFVADYHALNTVQDHKLLHEYTMHVVNALLAFGLDLDKITLYRQSDVPEIFELTTTLMPITPKGLMNRAHAYKAAIDQNVAQGVEDVDIGVNMGLYTYPVLMAADILVCGTHLVPVGKDQLQHIEIARDLALKFNHIYGETLTVPKPWIQEDTLTVPGLDGRKMSKSYNNIIPLFTTPADLEKHIKKIKTDARPPEEPKDPEEILIYQLYQHFARPTQVTEMAHAFQEGKMGYGEAKKLLVQALRHTFEEPWARYAELMANPSHSKKVLADGAARTRKYAQETLQKVRRATGIEA